MICKTLVWKIQCREKAFKLEYIYICAYLVCLHLWMNKTVPGWPKCKGGGRRCCCPCPRSSSPKPAPGLAWQSSVSFPQLPNDYLLSVAFYSLRFPGKQTSFVQGSLCPAMFILSIMGGQQTVWVANRLLQLNAAAALFISLSLLRMVLFIVCYIPTHSIMAAADSAVVLLDLDVQLD